MLSDSRKLIGVFLCSRVEFACRTAVGETGSRPAAWVNFDSSAPATKYSSWRNFMGETGFARPVHRMHCKSDWIRFLNRSATHPVRLISRELGDFLTKLLLFRKDDSRQRLYQDALSGSGPEHRRVRPSQPSARGCGRDDVKKGYGGGNNC